MQSLHMSVAIPKNRAITVLCITVLYNTYT